MSELKAYYVNTAQVFDSQIKPSKYGVKVYLAKDVNTRPSPVDTETAKKMKEIIEGMIRIESLWVPRVADVEHRGEVKALHEARDMMLNVLSICNQHNEGDE